MYCEGKANTSTTSWTLLASAANFFQKGSSGTRVVCSLQMW